MQPHKISVFFSKYAHHGHHKLAGEDEIWDGRYELKLCRSMLYQHTEAEKKNAFSLIYMYEFSLSFHWNCFLRFELTIFQHWFR